MKKSNASLRAFYELGKRVAELREETERVHGTFAKLRATSAAAKNRRMEAHRFYKLYRDQLDWICSLGVTKGKPLTRSHVILLQRIFSSRKRRSLAAQCSRQGWSVQRLDWEVRQLAPRRTYGGARYKPSQSVNEALLVTERLLRRLIRWLNVMSLINSEAGKPPIDELPHPIPQKLRKILGEAETLEKLCAKKRGQPAKPRSKTRKTRR
ncbi:MAG: hypothetical protein WD738_22500 [Pirellulales bacterium]